MPEEEYASEGEVKYMPIIRFDSKEQFDAFQKEAKKAIDTFCQKPKEEEEEDTDLPF